MARTHGTRSAYNAGCRCDLCREAARLARARQREAARPTGTSYPIEEGATLRGGFVMLGKTFKGLTDAMLAWQTNTFLALETGRDGHTVYVRPELVVEIAFNDVQASPQYPGGLALRFARVKRYRPDKTASEADTIDTVRAIHRQATAC